MKKTLLAALVTAGTLISGTHLVFAADSTSETQQDVKNSFKKAGRKVDDATCPMVNGKLDCTARKMKHGVQNAADDVKAKADK